jgi:hypothetical protein
LQRNGILPVGAAPDLLRIKYWIKKQLPQYFYFLISEQVIKKTAGFFTARQ